MNQSEKDIQAAILDYLKARGILCWRMQLGGLLIGGRRVKGNINGHPDLAAVLRPSGRYVAIEVKKPGKKLRDEQLEWQRDLRAQGVLCFVATSVEDVRIALTGAEMGVGA